MSESADFSGNANHPAGAFLVIDGPDGAGKSTQLQMLAGYLRSRGVEVVETRDPGGTAIGDQIRNLLLDRENRAMTSACELMLYMASRTQLYGEIIAPALAAGRCVLCDRWVSSTVAYQVAGGQEARAVRQAYDAVLPDVRADLTILLDIPADEGLRRAGRAGAHDRMEAKGLDFHRKVRELFLAQARAAKKTMVVVDGLGSVESIHAKIVAAVREQFADA